MKLSTIADKISKGEEITWEELAQLKKAVARTNAWHQWNTDDIVSKLTLLIKKTYNVDATDKEKWAWIFKSILWICQDEWEIERNWTLYFKSIPHTWDVTSIPYAEDYTDELNFKIMEEHFTSCLTPIELYIYKNNIQWDLPYMETAKKFWVSPQWIELLRDNLVKKIKDYIDNYLK